MPVRVLVKLQPHRTFLSAKGAFIANTPDLFDIKLRGSVTVPRLIHLVS